MSYLLETIQAMKIELYNEDCLETLSRIESGTVDLLLQDTPFGVTQNDWDIKPDLKTMWPEWVRVGKENAAFIFFATQPFASDLIESNRKIFKYDLIWEKDKGTGFLNANKMPLRCHETILIFYKKLPTYNPQKDIRKVGTNSSKKKCMKSTNYREMEKVEYKSTFEAFPRSVLNFYVVNSASGIMHPTQKPVDLIRYLINTYSNEGELVFDGYSGSGTTAAACVMEGRNFIGSELNSEYYEQSLKRLRDLQLQSSLFSIGQSVEECDASKDDSSNGADTTPFFGL
jgi:DNA modification methylase